MRNQDGSLWAFGFDGGGQLGDGGNTNRNAPFQLREGGVAAVSAGELHSLLLAQDDTVWAFGYNDSGRLGTGDALDQHAPRQVASGVAQIAAGGSHTLLLGHDGSVRAAGSNGSGQIGLGPGVREARNFTTLVLPGK